ncbi:MAG: hypothetical protein WBB85_11990, partial [Albidovulum sp.]
LGLADGTLLEAGMVDGKWVTKVAEGANGSEDGLKTGDILLSETNTGAEFTDADAIETAMAGLTGNGGETAAFTLIRDGNEMTVEVALARQP